MKSLVIILSLFSLLQSHAQNLQDTALHIKGSFDYFTIDNLENIYVVTQGGQLKKTNAHNDSIAIYNDVKKYGNISFIDVSNPLNILVFYKGQNTMVFLDQYLQVRNTISLNKAGVMSASAVCLAFDGNIWVYDEVENKIKKIRTDATVISVSADFRQLFNPLPTIEKLIDNNKYLYAYDPNQGMFIFDYYGSIKTIVPIKNWQYITIDDHHIYGWNHQKIQQYHLKTKTIQSIPIAASFHNIKQVYGTQNYIWLLDDSGLKRRRIFNQ